MSANNNIILILLLLLFISNSCVNSSSVDHSKSDSPKISKSKIILQIEIDSVPELGLLYLTNKYGTSEIIIDSSIFRIEFKEENPIIVKLSNHLNQEVPIFAIPADSVHIHIKNMDFTEKSNAYLFTGTRIQENIALSKIHTIVSKLNKYNINDKLDCIFLLDQKFSKNINTPYFNEYIEVFLKYKLGRYSEYYLTSSENILGKKYFPKPLTLLEQKVKWLNIYPYTEFLNHQINEKSGELSEPSIKFPIIDSLFNHKQINEICKYQVINDKIEYIKMMEKFNLLRKANYPNLPRIGQSFDYTNYIDDIIEFYKSTQPSSEFMIMIDNKLKNYQEYSSQNNG